MPLREDGVFFLLTVIVEQLLKLLILIANLVQLQIFMNLQDRQNVRNEQKIDPTIGATTPSLSPPSGRVHALCWCKTGPRFAERFRGDLRSGHLE